MTYDSSRGRITGIDTARGVAILGMIATHIFPLVAPDEHGLLSPTWVGWSLTGVSSALFVVLAGVGLSLLTANTAHVAATRVQLTVRAVVLIGIGLVLGLVGSNIAIILVHYGVMFLLAMWFITLSRRALTLTALSWLVVAPWVHGVLTRFMHVQAGGSAAYMDDWRLWTSPTVWDVFTRPLVTLWDVLFSGYYPVISFFGYVLVGMAIGRADLKKRRTGLLLLVGGAVTYVASRGLAAWLLGQDDFAYRVAHVTGTALDDLPALAATGSRINTDLLAGAPHWFGLAVPHSGAPLDIYSTAGAAVAVLGLFLVLTTLRPVRIVLVPITATGMIALTAYTVHVLLKGLWPSSWPTNLLPGAAEWTDVWVMLAVHWALVVGLGLILWGMKSRGPLEALLRNLANSVGRSSVRKR